MIDPEQFTKKFNLSPELHKTITSAEEVNKIINKSPSPLDINTLLHDPITTASAPIKHVHHTICPSTQDLAKNHLMHKDEPAIFTTDFQYAGYGRNGKWIGGIGQSLLASIIIPKQNTKLPITLIASFILRDYLQEYTTEKCQLKWPNDILVAGHKIAGILAESSACNTFWVIGIGLNLHADPTIKKAPQTPFPPSYFNQWTTKTLDRTSLIHTFADKLMQLENNMESVSTTAIKNWYKFDVFYKKGTASKDQVNIKGIGMGINSHGHYLVQLPNGNNQPVIMGGIAAAPEEVNE